MMENQREKMVIHNDATDAENYFFGPFQYACGDTLPGGYFDADSMRKEVTFVGLYFSIILR